VHVPYLDCSVHQVEAMLDRGGVDPTKQGRVIVKGPQVPLSPKPGLVPLVGLQEEG
jgi:hypothetical protein